MMVYKLNKIVDNHVPIEIGGMFELTKIVKIPERNLNFPLQIITQSPIIIRIPVEQYGGKFTNTAPYKSIFWRSDHPIDLFINSLETNMKKKFEEFTGKSFKEPIFEKFNFKKQVSTKIILPNSKVPVIGSLWDLVFSRTVPITFQKFALDCGIGQRNSLGFGFVNPIFDKKYQAHKSQ